MSIAPERPHIEPDHLSARNLLNVAPCSAEVQDGRFLIDGVDVCEIAENFGTAVYVYDEAHLRRQLSAYRDEFRKCYPESDIIYAAKSFCCVAMDKIVAEEGCCIDLASGGELAFAKAADFPMGRVYVQGNNKTPREIAEAMDAGACCFVVDTHEELDRINAAAKERGFKQKVFLRICPGIEADTHAYIQTANEDSKFGFNIRNGAAEEATRFALGLSNIDLAGYHCHIGSQIFELSSYVEAIKVMIEFMVSIREKLDFTARCFDIGGGLGIRYTIYDQPTTIANFAQVATDAIRKYCERYDFPLPHLYVEPGRSISANAGVTLYTVGSVKEVPGICTYVAVDGGMTDNIRTALYDSKYEAFIANRAEEPRDMVCDVVGKHCESGDVIVRNSSLQSCKPGDIVCVLGTGAYCHEMASNYNKQVRPAVIMIKDGQAHEVVRRETYDDLLAREII